MDYFILSLTIILIIIGLSGISAGVIVYYYLKNKEAEVECPKCKGDNVYLLKMMKFCPTCDKNVGVYKCNDCKYDFLECKHRDLDMDIKK
ncbi:MAG: hypothetical protein GF329_06460 [Candidatus Lokiarchaeota archaeon]|nr:hypothetical protein [Candidatus Lokiarchaeota archaeon]